MPQSIDIQITNNPYLNLKKGTKCLILNFRFKNVSNYNIARMRIFITAYDKAHKPVFDGAVTAFYAKHCNDDSDMGYPLKKGYIGHALSVLENLPLEAVGADFVITSIDIALQPGKAIKK